MRKVVALLSVAGMLLLASSSAICEEKKEVTGKGGLKYKEWDGEPKNYGYTDSEGVVVINENTTGTAFAFLRVEDKVVGTTYLVGFDLKFHGRGKDIKAGNSYPYNGWVYEVTNKMLSGKPTTFKLPIYVFVSDEKNKGSGTGYPVFLFYEKDGDWSQYINNAKRSEWK
jgi:hypothetical protein